MKRVFAHIGFSIATALFVLNNLHPDFADCIAAGLALLLAVSLCFKKYREAVTIPLCIASALFGCLLYILVYQGVAEPALLLNGKTGYFSFYITELPQFDGGKYIYTVKTTGILIDGAPKVLKLRLVTNEAIAADSYRIVNAYGRFSKIADNAFNSYGYWSDKIFLTVKASDFEVTDKSTLSPLVYILNLRNDIIETFMKVIKNDEGALSAALVTGDKYYLSDEVKQAFRLSGSSHIIAVSGLHISVVTGGIYYVLKHMGIKRKITSAVIILITLLYMALADFSGSVTRAGIMMIVFMSAAFFNKKPDSLNSLGFAVFIMCLNPFAVSDAGTVLSVLSVLSLVVYYPYLNEKLFKSVNDKLNKHRDGIKGIIVTNAARAYKCILFGICIITFNLPALYLFFGYTTLTSILSNVTVLPLGSIATVLSFLTYISCKTLIFSRFNIFLCRGLNKTIIEIVKGAANIKLLTVPFSPYFAVIIAAIFTVCGIGFIVFKGKQIKTLIVFTYVVLCAALAFNLYSQYNNAEVLITQTGASAVICDGITVVNGVDNKSDFCKVKSFVDLREGKIDTLIGDSEYTQSLADYYGIEAVSAEGTQSINISDSFNADFYMDSAIYKIKNTVISFGKENVYADIVVTDNSIYDKNGVIMLDDGSVVYSVNSSDYSVRR